MQIVATMKAASLLFLAVFALASCERHSFSETKKLSQPHGAHGAHEEQHGEHAPAAPTSHEAH